MNFADFGSIIVALIATLGAWAAQRSASKAAKSNITVSGRIEAEKGAYERARALDVQTIELQNEELEKLRTENSRLIMELSMLKRRITKVEEVIPNLGFMIYSQEHSDSDEVPPV